MKPWCRVLRYFRPDAPRAFLAFGLMVVSVLLGVLKPWPLALIIDCVIAGKPLPGWLPASLQRWDKPLVLASCAAGLFLLHAGHGVFFAWQNYESIKVGLSGLARVRKELETNLVPMVGMHLEDGAWKDSRPIKHVTINPSAGYYYVHVGEEDGESENGCERLKRMYHAHGWTGMESK